MVADAYVHIHYLSSEEVLSEAKGLFSQWPNLSSEDKQKLVENITDRIIIGKDEIEITLAYLPSSLKDPCTEPHNFTHVLPSAHFGLRGRRSRKGYPEDPRTIGEHLRKRRMDLELTQKQTAQEIGVDENSITNWEKNRGEPELRYLPRIIQFLGYNPFPQPVDLGGRVKQYRLSLGMSLREFAAELRLDVGTLADWEKGKPKKNTKTREKLEEFLTRGL